MQRMWRNRVQGRHVGADAPTRGKWAAGVPVYLVRCGLRAPPGRRKPEAVLLEFLPSGIPPRRSPLGNPGARAWQADRGGAPEGVWMSVYAVYEGDAGVAQGMQCS